MLCYKKGFPSGTFSQTLDLQNFAAASRLCCQQNSSTVELVDYTHDGRPTRRGWKHTVYYTSIDPNFITLTCCGFVVRLVSTVVHQLARFRLT